MLSNYIVIMNNIVVPSVVGIEVKKNMINVNPRGILDIHLNGSEFMPGTAVIRTKTNVEDFFRINTPLIVGKRITTDSELAQALHVLSYMNTMRYSDSKAQAKLLACIAAGVLPVFMGVCSTFQTSYQGAGEFAGYDFLIGGTDYGTFLAQPYGNLDIDIHNDIIKKIPAQYTDDVATRGGIQSRYYVGRQPFVCTAVNEFIQRLPMYQEFRRSTAGAVRILQDLAVTAITGTEPIDLATLMLLKQASGLKVPVERFESTTEAIKVPDLETLMTFGIPPSDEIIQAQVRQGELARPYNMNWAFLLGLITPDTFYETFVREDTGEFVFRRASWMGDRLLSKQKFQNPVPHIILPEHSISTYQKLWGGKMGEVPQSMVFGTLRMAVGNGLVTQTAIGEDNRAKFGDRTYEVDPFNGLHSMTEYDNGTVSGQLANPDNALTFTDVFCASRYYDTRSDGLPVSDINISGGRLQPSRLNDHAQRMMSWICKYYHSYPYVTWVGFNSYFMAPLGAMARPAFKPTAASAAGVLNAAGAGISPFASIEALSLQRIVGKVLSVGLREDGSYSEEYFLLLGNAGTGLSMKA